jgi:Outer membrane protein beta-barrel domain
LRKLSAIAFVLCLLGAAAVAQVPTSGNVYFGYSLNHGTVDPLADTGTLNGWEASLEGRVLPHIGLVAEVSQQFGSLFFLPINDNVDVRTEQFLFGPRLSFRAGPVRPFVHVLVGVGHAHEINHFAGYEDSDTAFANTFGGGVDYRLAGPLNWRVELESLNTNFFGDWQHNTRFSTGIAVHF